MSAIDDVQALVNVKYPHNWERRIPAKQKWQACYRCDISWADGEPEPSAFCAGIPPDCSTNNAAFEVTFLEAGNLDAAPADTYRDELTLLVEPF